MPKRRRNKGKKMRCQNIKRGISGGESRDKINPNVTE
jgi:hypothetical protein